MRANELRIFSRAFVIVIINHSGTVKSIELRSILLRCIRIEQFLRSRKMLAAHIFVNEMSFMPWMNG